MKNLLLILISIAVANPLAAQSVGIGTNSPTPYARATIQAAGDYSTALQVRNPTGSVAFEMYVGGPINGHTFSMGTTGNMPIAMYTNNANRVFITGSGNVGIGTSSPAPSVIATLETPDYSTALQIRNPTSSVRFEMFVGGPNNGNTFSMGTNGNMPIALYTNNANRLFIAGNGNTGVGTDVPNSKLEVGGGLSLPIRTIAPIGEFTNIYSITDDDYTIIVNMQNAGNGIAQLNLPDPQGRKGRIYHITSENLSYLTQEGRNKVNVYYGNTLITELFEIYNTSATRITHQVRTAATLQSSGTAWKAITTNYWEFRDWN